MGPDCRRLSYRIFQAGHSPFKKEREETSQRLSATSEMSKLNVSVAYLPKLCVLIWWRRQIWNGRCSLYHGGRCRVSGFCEGCSFPDHQPPVDFKCIWSKKVNILCVTGCGGEREVCHLTFTKAGLALGLTSEMWTLALSSPKLAKSHYCEQSPRLTGSSPQQEASPSQTDFPCGVI